MKDTLEEIIDIIDCENSGQSAEQRLIEIKECINRVKHKKYMVWDDLFGILAWKFKQTKSGDMYLDGEKVYNELKEKFELKRK